MLYFREGSVGVDADNFQHAQDLFGRQLSQSSLGVAGEIEPSLFEGKGDRRTLEGGGEALTTAGGCLIGANPVVEVFDFAGPGRWGGGAGGREGWLGIR